MQGHKRKSNKMTYSERRKMGPHKKKKMATNKEDREDFRGELAPLPTSNPIFEKYYKTQFQDLAENEFKTMINIMVQPLPVAFRINATVPKYERLVALFSNQNCMEMVMKLPPHIMSLLKGKEKEEIKEEGKEGKEEKLTMPVKKWDFYPNDSVYEFDITRQALRRGSGGLQKLHKIVQISTDCGLMCRQEIVSMLPPLCLDVRPGMKVLDMCAAPGSKTAQLLEFAFPTVKDQDLGSESTKNGLVLANDADYSRAYMLAHQLKRFFTASMVVLNQDAQNFPTIYSPTSLNPSSYDSRYLFDRILCDVPCSSDAAIRKIPEKWSNWNTSNSFGLHPLQIRILTRGIQLLKVGGMICYSTCSLNPIEDEAVVTTVLEQHKGALELVDVKPIFHGKFIVREGLKKWKVMNLGKDNNLKEYDSFIDVPEELQGKIRDTMFPLKDCQLPLNLCNRVLPHDQNTGGFFVAILKKVKEIEKTSKKEEDKTVKVLPTVPISPPSEIPRSLFKIDNFQVVDPEDPETQYIRTFYHLENFPWHLLYTVEGSMKKVYLVTNAVNDFLGLLSKQPETCRPAIVNIGVKCFARSKSKYKGSACLFRIMQSGAKYVMPYMTQRVIKCNIETFRNFLIKENVGVEEIEEKEVKETLMHTSIGSVIIYTEYVDNGVLIKEPLVMHKSDQRINVIVGSQELTNLKLRYLNW